MSAHFYESIDRVITAVLPEASSVLTNLNGTISINPGYEVITGIELTAQYDGDETVSYQWNLDGVPLPGAIAYYYVPKTAGRYTVTVSAVGYESIDSEAILVTSPKGALSGTIAISPETAHAGELLTATYTGIEDVNYQWNLDGIAIPNATANYYMPLTVGSYTVTASSEGYDSLISTAVTIGHTLPGDDPGGDTNPVREPGASVNPPTLASKTHNSITLNAVSAPSTGQTVEYAWNTANTAPTTGWQTGLYFSGLDPLTEYYLFTRSKENDNYSAGTASTGLAITTTPGPGDITSSAVKGVEIKMAWIPAGSFQMGSPPGEPGRNDDREDPQHPVTLSSGFYMGVYQVTQEQYAAIIGSYPSSFNSNQAAGEIQVRRPVERVSWYDALVFCNQLSVEEGLTPAYRISNSTDPEVWGNVPTSSDPTWNAAIVVEGSTGYRLPTEAQWEYACRAEESAAFNDGTADWENLAVQDLGWFSVNSSSKTHEVGKKAANAWGLYDMHGNVYEWCWDWYNSGYYSSSPSYDPTGASSGSVRVGRGGSWGYSAQLARSAYRHNGNPNSRNYFIGFRLMRL